MNDFAASSARRHYDDVYRFVRRRSASASEAEDLTQEVFEAAAAALATGRLRREPDLAWLYTVARRRLIHSWRRRLETEPFDETDPPRSIASGDAYGPATVEAVVAALRQLPDAQRSVIVAKVFEGRSFAEIAAALDVTEATLRQRFSRGLASIRAELESKGVTP